jgi:hypothetical protein
MGSTGKTVQAPKPKAARRVTAARMDVAEVGLVMVNAYYLLHVLVDVLEHSVYRRDRFGIDLVSALGLNHVDHLFNHVDVRSL